VPDGIMLRAAKYGREGERIDERLTENLQRLQSVVHQHKQFSRRGPIRTRGGDLLDTTFLIPDTLHGRPDFSVDFLQGGTQFFSVHVISARANTNPKEFSLNPLPARIIIPHPEVCQAPPLRYDSPGDQQ